MKVSFQKDFEYYLRIRYFFFAFEDGANIKSNNVGVIMAETRTTNSIKILALETLRFRKRFLYNLLYLGF